MPCDSSHCEATGYEVAMAQVACLLDEIAGRPFTKSDWQGYHPRTYNIVGNLGFENRELGDALTAELCAALQDKDVTQYSLEMQLWWRDHQKADAERVRRETEEMAAQEIRTAALKKLTPEERAVLGLGRGTEEGT